ncbi:unnamed protein product [Mytilus edulis]|uniref:Fibrinogen C-terminal domain-containing protein n=1 Tax=Mytilus edulis TaxID=6550 RepID=A0A8S3UAC5_MYTED|nr:unnamed protein product [Mytilus edulis]
MINSVFRNRRNIHTIRGAMMIWICFGHCRGNRSEVSKNVNIIHFHEQKDKQFSFVDDLIGTNNVSSKIECAHLCANFYPCCASSFDHISNICLLNLECNFEMETTHGSNVLTKTRAVSSHILRDCSDLPPGHYDGIYKIQPENGPEMNVYCDMTTDGGGDAMMDVYMDSLNGMMFSTLDRDNDESKYPCSYVKFSAWWFNDCTRANINGLYTGHADLFVNQDRSVHWKTWHQDNSLKKTEMKIKPI